MLTYNLTDEQKKLLQLAVNAILVKRRENSFIVSFDMQGAEIIGIDHRFSHSLKDNLIALAQEDLITLRQISQYDLSFSVKQTGFDAVDSGFEAPQIPAGANLSIGAIIYGGVKGGNIQAIGFANQSELEQVIKDPGLLSNRIEEYLDSLIDAVKDDLSRKSLTEYLETTEQLKEQLTSDNPDPSILKRLLQSLSFLGDIDGAISLTARVWPYIYPLTVIFSEILRKN